MRLSLLVLGLCLWTLAPAQAQEAAPEPPPVAAPADVASPDAIIAAVYESISGPLGAPRDWDRFRSLFIPEARLIPTAQPGDGGPMQAIVFSPEGYAEQATPYFEANGFYEVELHRTSEQYGPLLHAFSTYASYATAETMAADQPFARGINSFQLLDDGTRWWIVSIYWHQETPAAPIPEVYLGGS
ncbi:MAG: hypothetical protein AAGI71_04395 [Bacteroidota bacterium]